MGAGGAVAWRPIPLREIGVALAVLVPAWAIVLRLRADGTVLWAALALGVGLGTAAVALQRRHDLRPRVGRDVWLAVPTAVLHLVVSYVAVPVAAAVVPLLGRQAENLVFDARGAGLPTAAVVVIAAVVVAPLEELFWRGTVQPSLGAGLTRTAAVVVTTAAFVGYHVPTLQLPLMAAAALGGLVWGWLRERTGGLAAPVLAHAAWTAAMVVAPPT